MIILKRVYRSKKNRWLTGLCGGLGEFFGIDANIVRLVAVLLECSVLGFIAYFIVSYYVPEQPDCEKEPVKAECEDSEGK